MMGVLRRLLRRVSRRRKVAEPKDLYQDLDLKSTDELLSLMRHDSHRIEKAVYNNILQSKSPIYRDKWHKLAKIHNILAERGIADSEPTLAWSRAIYCTFENLAEDFVERNSLAPSPYEPGNAQGFVDFLRERRSVRVWSERQPDNLEEIALQMIDAARWAPTSGNRQPWRFLILETPEKQLLQKIKEEHCITAPLLIFVGMDTRVYGALGKDERGVYIDAGAAIMQMVLLAHRCGLGVCWNHFADDLIDSREANQIIYATFARQMKIPGYVTPIAIVAIGAPKFIPPEPARMDIDHLLLRPVKRGVAIGPPTPL